MVCTFHSKFTFLVIQPDDAIVRLVKTEGDFEYCLNLKWDESSSKGINLSPSCVLVNKGKNHWVFDCVSRGGDDLICGRGGQPLIIPNVYELSIPHPSSSPFFNYPQAAMYASPRIRK